MAQSDPRPMPHPAAAPPRQGDGDTAPQQMEGQARPPAPQQGGKTFTDWASI